MLEKVREILDLLGNLLVFATKRVLVYMVVQGRGQGETRVPDTRSSKWGKLELAEKQRLVY